MRLASAQVRLYRNIVDSGSTRIEPNVTCLVGKNESGKTAFLRALYNLKPAYELGFDLDLTDDYPRWRRAPDAKERDLGAVAPTLAKFSLDEPEIAQLSEEVGFPLPPDTYIVATRTYGKVFDVRLEIDQHALVRLLVESAPLPPEVKDDGLKCTSVQEFATYLREQQSKTPKDQKSIVKALADIVG